MMSGADQQSIPTAEIYILQGDDDLSIRDYLKDLSAQLRAEDSVQLDVARLEGRTFDRAAITQALNSLSLLSPRRLVILEEALELMGQKDAHAWWMELLRQMPGATVLVLLIPDSQRYVRGGMVWEKVGAKHWLHQCLRDCGKQVEWQEKPLPSQRDMPGWIMTEVEKQGGHFDGRAAAELANLVGNNLFQARQEISKALSYVGPEGTVSREDVRLLCSQSREEDIFAMVDAVGARNTRQALGLLQRLLQDLPAQYIYTMLARQVRLLIMARETLDSRGKEDDLAAQAHLHAFVAKKAFAQCRKFNLVELVELYRRLDRMDEDAKTGNVTLEVAMESLIADLGQG